MIIFDDLRLLRKILNIDPAMSILTVDRLIHLMHEEQSRNTRAVLRNIIATDEAVWFAAKKSRETKAMTIINAYAAIRGEIERLAGNTEML